MSASRSDDSTGEGHTMEARQLSRHTAVLVYLQLASADESNWFRWLASTAESELWLQIEHAHEEAIRGGWTDEQLLAEYALAAHLFGYRDQSREILAREIPDMKPVSEPSEGLDLASEFLAAGNLEGESLEQARSLVQDGKAGWPVTYMVARSTRDPEILRDLRGQAEVMYQRAVVATYIGIAAVLLGVGCMLATWPALRRKPAPWIKVTRLQSAWDWSVPYSLYFISASLALAAYYVIYLVLYFAAGAMATQVISYFVMAALPAIAMWLFMMPGLSSGFRQFFRATKSEVSWLLLVMLGAGLYAFWGVTAGYGLYYLEILIGTNDVRDYVDFGVIDTGLSGLITGLIIAAVIAPVCEEIIFRGFLFGALRNRVGVWAAAVGSSMLFSLVHWYSPYGALVIFLFGLICCWAYYRTNSLVPSIVFHALNNFVLILHLWLTYSFDLKLPQP